MLHLIYSNVSSTAAIEKIVSSPNKLEPNSIAIVSFSCGILTGFPRLRLHILILTLSQL